MMTGAPPGQESMAGSVASATTQSPESQTCYISRLPPELLSRIFVFYARSWPTYSRPHFWINVTHVSRQWREAGLQYPALWSSLSSHCSTTLMAAMLERSKEAPLDVTIDINASALFQPALDQVFPQVHRFRTFTLTLSSSAAGSDETKLITRIGNLKGPAPLLEELALTCYLKQKALVLPNKFFGTSATKLSRLSLTNFRFSSWEVPFLSGLTSLQIHYTPGKEGQQSHQDLLGLLRQLRNVQHLDLAFIFSDTAGLDKEHVADLPNLRKLLLKGGNVKSLAQFIARISIPMSAQVDLSLELPFENQVTFTELISSLKSSWLCGPSSTTSAAPIFRSLTLNIPYTDVFQIKCYVDEVNFFDMDPQVTYQDNPALELRIRCQSTSVFSDILELLPLAEVCALALRAWASTPTLDILSRLPRLRTMALFEPSARETMEYMMKDPSTIAPAKYFPALQMLSLNEIDYTGELDEDYSVELSLIQGVVDKRMWMEAEIDTLGLRRCYNFYANDMNDIYNVDICWDRHEMEMVREEEEEEDEGDEDEDAIENRELTAEDLFEDGDDYWF